MNKILIFLFLSSFQLFALNWEFSWVRIDVNFNGVINSDSVILCYGTGSMILRTYDIGNSWEQENVFDDSLDIEKMLYVDNKFIGILNRDYIVLGDKYGKNWQSIVTGLDNQVSMAVTAQSNYILSKNIIYEYDDRYKLVNSISIKDTNKFNEIAIFKDKLLAGGDDGTLAIFDLNDNYRESIIDFKKIGFCIPCPSVKNFIIQKNKVYLSFNGDVYESQDLQSWSLKGRSIRLFDIKNDIIYDARTYGSAEMPSSTLEMWKTDSLINKKVSKDWELRNVDILAFTDFKFIDESTAFAVGRDKLIARTKDGGLNWDLISNYKPAGIRKLNDTVFHAVHPGGKVYLTKDAGITWLPCLLTESSVLRLSTIETSKFYSDGFGFVKYSSFLSDGTDLLLTYDFGNSFVIRKSGVINTYKSEKYYSIIRTDTGFNVLLPNQYKNYFSTVVLMLDTAFNYLSKTTIDSVHVLYPQERNEQTLISVVRNFNWPYNLAYGINDSNFYSISISKDDGITWEKELDLNMQDTSLSLTINFFGERYLIGGNHWYKEHRDTPNVHQLYLIDRSTKQRHRIFNDVLSGYDDVEEINNNLLIPGWERIIFNENFSDNPFIWSHYLFNGKYFRKIYPLKDKLWAMVFDIKNRIDHYYHLIIKTNSDVETQTEIKTYLFSYPPYPIPAINLVKSDIYWDMRYNIDDADIGVFNYTGLRLSEKNEFTIDKKNNYSGILTWDCSGYPKGVYFIVIRHGDASRLIPVVVNR